MATCTELAICAGVGWLSEGLRAGLEYFGCELRTVCHIEREAYAAATLVARMEEQALEQAPIWDDLTTFDGKPWRGKVDCITAGFPCQPWSTAGKRQGREDARWLWPNIAGIIDQVGPSIVFLENVPGLFGGDGSGIGCVLDSLAAMRFDAEWCHITAAEVGASHKRERVFILAHRGLQHFDLFQWPQRVSEHSRSGSGMANTQRAGAPQRRSIGRASAGRPSEEVADPSSKRQQKRASEPGNNGAELPPTERNCGIFAPGPHDPAWQNTPGILAPAIEPGFRVLVDGCPLVVDESRADQLRCGGNGVVPLQAAAAFVELVRRVTSTTDS